MIELILQYIPGGSDLIEVILTATLIIKPIQTFYTTKLSKYVNITLTPRLLRHPAYKAFHFLVDWVLRIKFPEERKL